MEDVRTIPQLASKLAKMDEGKSEAKIGDIRELLANLADLCNEDPRIFKLLGLYALDRAKK